MATTNPASKKVGGNKLPKGEFPSNIHILKGAPSGETNVSRGVKPSGKFILN